MIIEFTIENYDRYKGQYANKVICHGSFTDLEQFKRSAKVDENYHRKWTLLRVVSDKTIVE